jgi:predicted DNA-binding protein
MVEYTNIRLKRETVEKLKKLGFKGETYDDIINRLIECYKNRVNGDV